MSAIANDVKCDRCAVAYQHGMEAYDVIAGMNELGLNER